MERNSSPFDYLITQQYDALMAKISHPNGFNKVHGVSKAYIEESRAKQVISIALMNMTLFRYWVLKNMGYEIAELQVAMSNTMVEIKKSYWFQFRKRSRLHRYLSNLNHTKRQLEEMKYYMEYWGTTTMEKAEESFLKEPRLNEKSSMQQFIDEGKARLRQQSEFKPKTYRV